MKKYRILRIVSTMNPEKGGVVEAIKSMSKPLSLVDVSTDVLSFDDPNESWVKNSEVEIIAIGRSYSAYSINFAYPKWLKDNCQKYDLVVFDGLWQFLSLGWIILKQRNIPYFVFVHGMLDPYFNKNLLKYLKKLPFWYCIEKLMLNNARSVIYTSVLEKELADNSFPGLNATTNICCLGVSDSAYKEYKSMQSKKFNSDILISNRKYALFLSRVHQKKGIDLLIKAVSKVKLPEDFVFVIAGPDTDGLRGRLKSLAVEFNVESKFIWLDMVTGAEKWHLYQRCDFFVLPSHQENFGIVVAEALMCSAPVLITDKINIFNEIAEFNAGIIAVDTVQGVETLINSWFSLNSDDRYKMRENARRCYENNFGEHACAERFRKIIEERL